LIKDHIIYTQFSPWTFDLQKAQGVYLWDQDGKKYVDFTSGWNVMSLGWNHPEVRDAIIAQAKKNIFTHIEASEETKNSYAKQLVAQLPDSLTAIGKATGGTEAIEEALKTARAYTGRKKIIGFADSYHGQSFGAMAIGWRATDVEAFAPLVPECIQIEYPKTSYSKKSEEEVLFVFEKNLENLLKTEDVAVLVTESGIITGWGTTYVAPKGYLTLVRKLTKKYGTLLLLDEVGTGFSRTGKLFGMQHEEVTPDIVVFAKGMTNGMPMGAMVTTEKIAETADVINLTSTFGWNPICAAAAKKVLEIHLREKLWEKAEKDGAYMMQQLKDALADHPYVGEVRGMGMEIGVDLVKDKKTYTPNTALLKKVEKEAKKRGLYLNSDTVSNIQLMPPLIIERKDLDRGIDILVDVIKSLS
jgi:4-aminobutyrate aminotransferase-like enzyme